MFFGEDDGAVGLAGFAEMERDGVGRIGFKEMVDALRERSAGEAMAEHLRREDIGDALNVIAGAGMSLDADTELAEFFNPAPDLLARDADFAGDFRTANDDGRVFEKQCEQRVDAAVGGAGKSCHALVRHREEGSIPDAAAGNKVGPTHTDRVSMPLCRIA